MQWLRLYHALLDNTKVQWLEPALFKAWVNLLLAAARHDQDDGVLPCGATLEFWLRRPRETIIADVERLADAGLIDRAGGWYAVHDWKQWQHRADTSTARVQAHRAKKAEAKRSPATGGETLHETLHGTLQGPLHETSVGVHAPFLQPSMGGQGGSGGTAAPRGAAKGRSKGDARSDGPQSSTADERFLKRSRNVSGPVSGTCPVTDQIQRQRQNEDSEEPPPASVACAGAGVGVTHAGGPEPPGAPRSDSGGRKARTADPVAEDRICAKPARLNGTPEGGADLDGLPFVPPASSLPPAPVIPRGPGRDSAEALELRAWAEPLGRDRDGESFAEWAAGQCSYSPAWWVRGLLERNVVGLRNAKPVRYLTTIMARYREQGRPDFPEPGTATADLQGIGNATARKSRSEARQDEAEAAIKARIEAKKRASVGNAGE